MKGEYDANHVSWKENSIRFYLITLCLFSWNSIYQYESEDNINRIEKRHFQEKDEKVVVSAFWEMWYKIYRKLLPEPSKLSGEYKNKNVRVIWVSHDEEQEKVHDWLKKSIEFPVYSLLRTLVNKERLFL